MLFSGEFYIYDVLVVVVGIQINWDQILGFKESVGKVGMGVCSNYFYNMVESIFENIRNLKKGMVIFIYFLILIKCGGVLIKIIYLVLDYWRRNGVVVNIKKKFIKGGLGIFVVKKYVDLLIKVVDRYGIEWVWKIDLVEL